MLGIDRGRLSLGNPEEGGVERSNVVEEGAPLGHRPAGHTRLGVVVLLCVPPVTGNFGDEVLAPQQRVPQLLRGVDTPGKSTRHSNNSNGDNTSCVHYK